MKKKTKCFLAVILAVAMLFQQGAMDVLLVESAAADDKIATSEVSGVNETGAQVTEPSETELQVTKPKVEESKVEEPKVEEPKSTEPEVANTSNAAEPEKNAPKAAPQQTTKTAALQAAPQPREVVEEVEFEKLITSAEIKVQINGTWYLIGKLPSGMTVPKDAPVDVKIAYNPEGIQFAPGAKLTYRIPNGIIPTKVQNGEVKDGPALAGTYVIDANGLITITLDPDYIKKHDGYVKNGTINFNGSFNKDVWGQGGDKEIVLGKDTITIPFTPDPIVTKGVVNVKKEIVKDSNQEIKYDATNKCYYIEYKITVSTPADNTMTMPNVTVDDIFTAGSDYLALVNGHPDIYDVTPDAGSFAFNGTTGTWTGIGDMARGTSHVLTFKVKLNESFAAAGDTGDRTVTNKATVKSDGNKKNEASISTNANSGLNIAKTTTGYNSSDKTVTYTITVKALANNTWPISNVTVDDIFGDNKDYVTEYTPETPSKGEITNIDYNTDKKLAWNIGTMKPGEEATLTYTVRIDDKIFLKGTGGTVDRVLKNTAYLKVNNKDRGNSNASVDFRKVWIWKNGELQTSGKNEGKIKFTIHANETTSTGTATIPPISANITFTDNLSGNWVYDGNVVIQRYTAGPHVSGTPVGDPVTINVDGKTSWTWTDPQQGAYFYEVIYYARVDGTVIGKPSISNGAGIGVGVGGSNYGHNTSWSGTGKQHDALFKEFVERDGNIASWQSKITCDVPEGAVYRDWKDGPTDWWFTQDQLKNDIKVTQGATTFAEGADYEIQYGSGEKCREFTITFKHPIAASEQNPILIDYKCTLATDKVAEGTTATYRNRASLTINGNTDSSYADCTYTNEQLIKKTAGKYDEKTGEMRWNIKINTNGTMKGSAVVTDTLPEGMEFVSAAISKRGSKAVGTTMTYDNAAVGTKNVTMNISGLVDSHDEESYINIQVISKVADEEFLTSNGKKTYSNKATLDYEGNSKDSEADVEIENRTLTKEGRYKKDTAPDIVYTITVNPNGLDMLKEADTIRIEDTMGENMMLNTDSLKVVDTKNKKEIDVKSTLKIDGNVFSFDVPDNVPLEITYKAYVKGAVGEHVKVTNTVSYYGKVVTGGNKYEKEIIVAESNATIEGEPAFYIAKKDDGDKTTPLSGAKFILYVVDPNTGEVKEPEEMESDEDGFIYFTKLDENTVYGFQEARAPEGYYINEANRTMTYVAFNKNAVTDAMKDLKIDIIQKGTTYDRFNAKGQITVKKAFETCDNSAIPDGKYYFSVFDSSDKLIQTDYIEVKDGEVQNDITFKNLNLEAEGQTPKNYKVYETDKAGKKLTGDANGNVLIHGAMFKITGDGDVAISQAHPEENITITNTEAPLELSFEASKQLENVAGTTQKEFNFGLYDSDRNLLQTKQNGSDGKILFDKIAYTRETLGEHEYTIKEIPPERVTVTSPTKDGITYDFTEYKVVVNVTHNLGTGLKAVVTVNGKVIQKLYPSSGVYVIPNKEKASFVNVFAGSAELTKVAAGAGADGGKVVLKDAEFKLYKVTEGQDPTLIYTYTTNEDGIIRAENLAEGKYYFVETKAPTGYGIQMDANGNPLHYSFEIGPNGGSQVVDYSCEAADDAIHFNVNKVDLNDNTKEIAGAELAVFGKDEDGNYSVELDRWISAENETHDFGDKLEAGKDYVLREVFAPEGYAYIFDIYFAVNEDGTIAISEDIKTTTDEETGEVTYLVEDDITRLTVLKVDENGNAVVGAKLVIKDAEGNVIKDETGAAKYSWVTTGEPHELGGIPAGEYILSEVEAPAGYELAEDVPFTLSDEADAVNEVTMVDKKTPESYKGSIAVTKTLKLEGYAADVGVDDAVFYVALFDDEARTHRISNVKPIIFKDQTAGTVVFENLSAGKYYIGETNAYGELMENGYLDEAEYQAQYGDGYFVNLESNTFAGQIHFENVFEKAPKRFYYEGTLSITKNVIRNGKAWNTDHVYYAGVFYDKEYTKLFKQVELKMNGKSSTTVEIKVPLGRDPDKKVDFYVTEVDKNGKPLKNGKNLKFEVSVKGTKVTMSGRKPLAKVTITNTYKTRKNIVKTGDQSRIMTWLVAMGAAILAVILMALVKKRKR